MKGEDGGRAKEWEGTVDINSHAFNRLNRCRGDLENHLDAEVKAPSYACADR